MLQNTSNFPATFSMAMSSNTKFGRTCFRLENENTSGSERRLFIELSAA